MINSESEVNAIFPTFVKELSLPIRPTKVGAQKINSTTLDTYKIVVTTFSMTNKTNQVKIFKEIFLMVNVSLEVVFVMFFLILSDENIDFSFENSDRKLIPPKKPF